MTLDDFEWVEEGFDNHLLVHKTHDMTIAAIKNFNGWYIHALKAPRGVEQIAEHIDNLEAAKVIATIYVNQNMKGYPDVLSYRARTPNPKFKKVPAGVFKVDKLRP
jgi:hypothetical protein